MGNANPLRARMRLALGLMMGFNLILIWPLATVSMLTIDHSLLSTLVFVAATGAMVYIAPAYIRFRRVAFDAGYSKGKAFSLFFFEGMTLAELKKVLKQKLAHEDEWDDLLARVKAEEPQLLALVRQMHEEDRMADAKALIARTKREREWAQDQRLFRRATARGTAAAYGCESLVDPMLDKGDLEEAEQCLVEVSAFRNLADQYGLRDEVGALISKLKTPDFDTVRSLLDTARQQRKRDQIQAHFEPRINCVPMHDQSRLKQMLADLLQLPIDSREYRRAEHDLSQAIDRVSGRR